MKEPAWAIHNGACPNKRVHPQRFVAYGSFKTISNPLRQLPTNNLIIPETPFKSNYFKRLNHYVLSSSGGPHDRF
jgi:hypothetical protein